MEKEPSGETSKKPAKRQNKQIWANLSNTHYVSVKECMEEFGYKFTESISKNMIFWYDAAGTIEVAGSLEPWQFYNHFPGVWSIARKVELARNLERMAKMMPEVYKFHPKTFLIPGQCNDMKAFMQSIPKKTNRTMIIKPDRGAQGKGIMLIQDPDALDEYFESAVAQQYIKPFLIDGYKFDLRIYVLVTSVDPLRVYIHNEGMARFCTEKYEKPKSSNLDQVFGHLTNYSLNKKNENFVANENVEEADCGSKRSLSSVMKEIEALGHSVKDLQLKIDDIIRLTLASIQPFLATNYHAAVQYNDGKSRCFEILGFDVMIDKNMNPWLIEVNCMPSLTCDSPFDTALKYSVIKGTLKILNLNPAFKKATVARQRAVTQKRISGVTKMPIKDLFDPQVESSLAATTNWRELYPSVNDRASLMMIDSALSSAKEVPVGAAVETAASRARKEAVLAKIREKEREADVKRREAKKRPPFQTDFSAPPPQMRATKPKPTKPSAQKPKTSKTARTPNVVCALPPVIREDDERLILVFKDLPLMFISEGEERVRLKALRQQAVIAQSTTMFAQIKRMLASNDPKQHHHDPIAQTASLKHRHPTRPVKQTLVKPVIKQVVVSDY